MKINKFEKLKGSKYKLHFDDLKVTLYDDIIIKYNLLISKDVDNKTLKAIMDENDRLDAYYAAIKYINIKLRSEVEIEKYLSKKEYDKEIIKETISKLKKNNFLNLDLYLSSYINDQINLSLNGPNKIIFNLKNLGYEESIILKQLNSVNVDWQDRISKIISKKIKTNHKSSNNELKNKIRTDLINLGYEFNMISEGLECINVDDSAIFEKVANKYYEKYKRKYNKTKLDYYFRGKMFSLGYDSEQISAYLSKKNTD